MKTFLVSLILCFVLWGCKKTVSSTGVPGKWKITSDVKAKFITAPPEIYENVTLKENPWYQFNKDGTGASMRDSTGAGAVINFTYVLSRDSTLSYYQPTIQITVPPQVVNGNHLDGSYQIMNLDQVNAETLKVDYITYDSDGGWGESLNMTRIN